MDILENLIPKEVPVLKLYNNKIPFQLSPQLCSQLVTSGNKLYVITYEYSMWVKYLSFYELDPETESVKQIDDLGSKSLFLSQFNSSLVDTTGWGAGNCVCVLHSYTLNRCSFFHLNGDKLATTPLYWNGCLNPYFWYIPGESCDISCVSDEFGTWSLLLHCDVCIMCATALSIIFCMSLFLAVCNTLRLCKTQTISSFSRFIYENWCLSHFSRNLMAIFPGLLLQWSNYI